MLFQIKFVPLDLQVESHSKNRVCERDTLKSMLHFVALRHCFEENYLKVGHLIIVVLGLLKRQECHQCSLWLRQ